MSTDPGGIYRSGDGGDTWSGNVSPTALQGIAVTRLATHPQQPLLLYATFAAADGLYVFASPDGGDNWRDIDGGKLPKAPLRALAVRADQPDAVYVRGDAGIFLLPDLAAS